MCGWERHYLKDAVVGWNGRGGESGENMKMGERK
ncbi:hypothetical protein L195_g047940, partial [Trifolium pratense]